MLYFYDANSRYVGRRALIAGEPVPERATETPVTVPDGHEAHYADGMWTVTEIPPAPEAPSPELTDIEKLKIRQDATENAILFLMDMNMGGML